MNERRFYTGSEQRLFRFPYLCIIIQIQHSVTIKSGRGLIFKDFLVPRMRCRQKKMSVTPSHLSISPFTENVLSVRKGFPYQEQLHACGLLTNQTK